MSPSMVHILVGLLLLAAPCYSSLQICDEYECKGEGFFAHLEKCGMFYKCVDGVLYFERCPGKLHFNSATQRCEDPKTAGCLIPDCSRTVEGYFANPADCRRYFQCLHGNAKLRSCNVGLHWDDKIKGCNWPDQAGCVSTKHASPVAYAFKKTLSGIKHSKAKAPKCDKDGLFPHQGDCGKFYQCSHGIAHLFDCPADLHFNVATGQCASPAVTNCKVPDCSGTEMYFPNPDDCTTYYQCSNGFPVLQHCPPGLTWDIEEETCSWSDGCDSAKRASKKSVGSKLHN